MHDNETIAAIGTAPGVGGISVIRVSGPNTFSIAEKTFRCAGAPLSERDGGTFVYGHTFDELGDLDEVLVLIMKAPKSYTCENMIEIQGHGGTQSAKRNLRAMLNAGARLAEPGEFTRRAFMNGRLDLMQAEAVLDLIHARSERAADAALEQLAGGMSESFNAVYDDLIQTAGDLEATLDFPEDELPDYVMPELIDRLKTGTVQFGSLLNTWDEGHFLREGASVVIAGRPNVGKSTMLNTLLKRDRSIVSAIPGTTRDMIEEGFILEGIPLRLMDTAGLRSTEDHVEHEGIRRARDHMEKADFYLYILDASQPLNEEDRQNLADIEAARCIVVLNKCDLGQQLDLSELEGRSAICCSLIHAKGIDQLLAAWADMLKREAHLAPYAHASISERHRLILVDVKNQLAEVVDQLETGRDDLVALASEHLRDALIRLGEATGREYHEELLDNIFSRFCIGK